MGKVVLNDFVRMFFSKLKTVSNFLRRKKSQGNSVIGPNRMIYREAVDFQEFIGYDVDCKTGKKFDTWLGVIHYTPNGCHIVPAKPVEAALDLKIEDALLAVQRALLGVVTPELRAVIVGFDLERDIFHIRFYHHGEVSDRVMGEWECATTEAYAALNVYFILAEGIERLDYPEEIPAWGVFAYRRKE